MSLFRGTCFKTFNIIWIDRAAIAFGLIQKHYILRIFDSIQIDGIDGQTDSFLVRNIIVIHCTKNRFNRSLFDSFPGNNIGRLGPWCIYMYRYVSRNVM